MSCLLTVLRIVLVSLLIIGSIPWMLDEAVEAQASVTGQWTTLPYLMPINPIHLGMLRTGKVLVVAGSENDPNKNREGISKAAVWDLQSGTLAIQSPPFDVFCNGMAFLPDGRALIVGGTDTYDPMTGDARAVVFDPITERFNQVESMKHGRWYATTTALDDGRILAFSGTSETGTTNTAVELYKVASGWSPEILTWPWPAPPLYPWMHLLPNGKVFYSGYGVGTATFDPATSAWTYVTAHQWNNTRLYGSSVLLPLLPEKGYAPRVLVMGGHNPSTSSAEIIDLSQAAPAWRTIAPMSLPRIEMNATLLPDGKVLASGGSLADNDVTTASRGADLFDPVSETWSAAGTATYARMYHSTALLLPDATVVTAGSNPQRGTYEQHIEIWTPPYLFNADGTRATRPTISGAPTRVGYAASFTLQSPDAANIGSIALMRAGSPTHAFDMEQRLIGLPYTVSGTTMTVQSPPNARIAPPGYYMVFILTRQGVPSVAKFVQISSIPSNVPPDGTITQPPGNVTIQAGQSVSFAGTGSDSDGAVSRYAWTFPGGTPVSVLNNPTPGAVTFTQPGTYAVALTVVDSLGENDPSPPTRTITVSAAAANQPPIASAGGPYAGGVGQAIAMNGSASSDPDGSIASYAWTFGDGATGTGATPTHGYASAGGYTVTLTVTDNAGATASATTSATVTATVTTPAAPSNLVLKLLARPKVTLQWSDNSSNESGFKLERSGDGRTFTQIATLGPNTTTYMDSGVNRTTYYRVRAYNSGGNSAYSNTLRVF